MSQQPEDRLDSWKEIASYLGRDIRTVRRWEQSRGLPIHRVPGSGRRVVFAFPSEIQTWLRESEERSHPMRAPNPKAPDTADQPAGFQNARDKLTLVSNEAKSSTPAEIRVISGAQPLLPLPQGWRRRVASARFFLIAIAALGMIAVILAVTGRRSFSRGSGFPFASLNDAEKVPVILSVTRILPQPRQRIVIQGKGLGLHVPYAHTDSSYLAIRDLTAQWAAGRIIPQNWDEVMLDVDSWTDSQIVVNGFSGSYGPNGWKLNFADELEIAVWNPQSGAGPALYHTKVVSTQAHR